MVPDVAGRDPTRTRCSLWRRGWTLRGGPADDLTRRQQVLVRGPDRQIHAGWVQVLRADQFKPGLSGQDQVWAVPDLDLVAGVEDSSHDCTNHRGTATLEGEDLSDSHHEVRLSRIARHRPF